MRGIESGNKDHRRDGSFVYDELFTTKKEHSYYHRQCHQHPHLWRSDTDNNHDEIGNHNSEGYSDKQRYRASATLAYRQTERDYCNYRGEHRWFLVPKK